MNFFTSRDKILSDKGINCHVITDTDGFRRLEPEWNDLLARSAAPSVFLTYEYLWTWWNVYGAAYKLRIVTARDDNGELIGIAPMMIGAGDSYKRRTIRHLVFIGGLGDTLSEDQDFVVAKGFEMAVVGQLVQLLMEQFADEWDVMQLRMVSSESPCLAPLGVAIEGAAGKMQCVARHNAPYVSLPNTWEAYLATRTGKFRTGFKARLRKLEGDHRVEVLTAGHEIGARDAIQIVASLCRERWGKASLAFKSDKYREFHSRLAEVLVPKKQAYIVVMKLDGEIAAAKYDLIHRKKVFGFQGGWKKSFARLAIGKIVLGKEFQWAIDQGLSEYDFLAGDSEYKKDWATGQRELLDFEVINTRSVRGHIYKFIWWLREKLRGGLSKG